MSDGREPRLFTSVQPDGSTRSYALAMPGALARAYASDPIGVGWALTQADYRVLRIQARATAEAARSDATGALVMLSAAKHLPP